MHGNLESVSEINIIYKNQKKNVILIEDYCLKIELIIDMPDSYYKINIKNNYCELN